MVLLLLPFGIADCKVDAGSVAADVAVQWWLLVFVGWLVKTTAECRYVGSSAVMVDSQSS